VRKWETCFWFSTLLSAFEHFLMDDPETEETAGTLSAVWMAAMCACFPTRTNQTNHRLDRRLGGGPAGTGFGAEPHLKKMFHFLMDLAVLPRAQIRDGVSIGFPPRVRGTRSGIVATVRSWRGGCVGPRPCHWTIARFAPSSPELSSALSTAPVPVSDRSFSYGVA